MGLKEIETTATANNNNTINNNNRWKHPPKKKWIHCYMSIGDEKKSEASELKSGIVVKGSADPLAVVSYTPSLLAASVTTTVCPLDRRGGIAIPSVDDRHLPRRRAAHPHHHYSSPNGRGSPHLSPSFSLSPSLLSSSSSSSLDSPLGLVSAFKGNNDGGEAPSNHQSPPLSHIPLESPVAGGRIQANGFLRPNGLSKPLSPLPRDFDDSYGKDDAKKRAGSTPSREVHNKLEKNRRAHLKECFETLRRQLPCMEDKKISNQTILKAAHRYIQNLKRKEREYEHEMERLARQKIAYQQQLASLKKELQAKWDHIDFSAILPDMASLEQNRGERDTKSTTTASEQPDFEDDSRDSSTTHSNSLTVTSSPELKNGFSSHPVDLMPHSASSSVENLTTYVSSSTSTGAREQLYQDPNQPLNLSTNTVIDGQKSPIRSPPQQQQHRNGEWPLRRNSHYAVSPYSNEDKMAAAASKPMIGRIHSPRTGSIQMTKVSTSAAAALGTNVQGRSQIATLSTNASHISSITVKGGQQHHHHQTPTSCISSSAAGNHISHLVKSGSATVSQLSTISNVVTAFPNLTSVPHNNNYPPNTMASMVGHVHNLGGSTPTSSHHHIIHQDSIVQTVPTSVTIGTNLTHVPHLSTMGTTVARVSTSVSGSNNTTSCVTVGSHEHSLPIVGGNGISIPAQLVASGVHLSGTHAGTILGQPTIQVITPDGYKLLPADHNQNGAKPLAITLTHPGLEHLSTGEDGKTGPVMVAVSKNGLSALHLTMPTSARALTNSIGTHVPVTSVPLNLTVGTSGTAVKVTQTGSTSILPSYLPLTHANGITQLVQGMSLVGPLVVSQSQRGVMVPTCSSSGGKGVKSPGGVSGNGGAGIPLVNAQYASTIPGGLVNSVVVVSAPAVVGQGCPTTSTASVVTSSAGMQSAKY